MADNNKLYPLKFKEILRKYGFGGDRIQQLLKSENFEEEEIAETWEVADHDTDASIIKNGYWSGQYLRGVIWSLKEKLVGKKIYEKYKNYFPLLLKFLDADRTLGLQIHPGDDYARKHNLDKMGKAELYYVLDCEEDSFVYWGPEPGVTREEMTAAVYENEGKKLTQKVPLNQGDLIYVPAGWIHALGKGTLIIELQQNADITLGQNKVGKTMSGQGYALYSGKKAADMFIQNMMIEEVPETEIKISKIKTEEESNLREYGFACKHFALERLIVENNWTLFSDPDKFILYTVIAGTGIINYKGEQEKIKKGETILIPSAMGEYEIVPETKLEIIKSYVPDLKVDIIDPLLEQGFNKKEIKQLGGYFVFNDIENIIKDI